MSWIGKRLKKSRNSSEWRATYDNEVLPQMLREFGIAEEDRQNREGWRGQFQSEVVPQIPNKSTNSYVKGSGKKQLIKTKKVTQAAEEHKWYSNVLQMSAALLGFVRQGTSTEQTLDLLQYCAKEGIIQQVVLASKLQKQLWLEKTDKTEAQYRLLQYVASDADVPLEQIIRLNCTDILEAILDHGVDVNLVEYEKDGWPLTPLHAAVRFKNHKAAALLLKAGANPAQRNCLLQTPLSVALQKGEKELALLLIKHMNKTDLNVEDTFGNTEIYYLLDRTLTQNDVDVLEHLIVKGADVHTVHPQTKLSPLLCAMNHYSGSPTIKALNLLLSRKVDPNCSSSRGITALHIACHGIAGIKKMSTSKQCQIVSLLLQFEANVNCVDSQFNTPLHLAAKNDFPKIVEILLDYNASVSKRNIDGLTPLDLATPDSVVYQIIAEHGPLSGGAKTPRPDSVFGFTDQSPAWTRLRVEVTSFESKLKAMLNRLDTVSPPVNSIKGNLLILKSTSDSCDYESYEDTHSLLQDFNRLKSAIELVRSETGTLTHATNHMATNGIGTGGHTLDRKMYSAFRTLSIVIGVDWKLLFRELVSEVDPQYTDILIHELEQKYHGQIREQTYQSLLMWLSLFKGEEPMECLKSALRELDLNLAYDKINAIKQNS